MAVVVNSTFVNTAGTNVDSHVGATGATWTVGSGFSNHAVISNANRARAGDPGGFGHCVFATGVSTTDGEYAEAIVETITTASGFGIFARGHVSLASVPRGYMAYYNNSSGLWSILRLDNSTTFSSAIAGTTATQALSIGSHTIRVTVTGTGASVAIELKIDGAVVLSVSDTSGSRITTFGTCGLYFDTTNSNSVGTHVTSITHTEGVSNSMTFTTPLDGKVNQLSSGSTGTATISTTGTYTGTAPDQWRLVQDGTSTAVSGFDWTSFGSAPSGGNFSQTISSVPKQSGWLNVQVRNSGTPGTIYTSGKVGTGVLVMVDGQSPAWLFFSGTSYAGDSSLTPNALLRITGIQPSSLWTAPATTTMNAAISCGNALVTACGCPVALIDGSWNGSGLTVSGAGGQWISGGVAGNAYTASAAALTAAGNKAVATIWIQGENDAGSSVTQSAYNTALGQMIALRRADVSDSGHPYIVATLARDLTGGQTDAQREAIKLAQVQKCADTAIYRVDRQDLPLHSDNVHHTAAGFTTLGQRCAQAVLSFLGLVSYYRGPRYSTVTQISSTVYDVNLTHNSSGTDFTPTSSITGFRALVSGSPVTISSVARQSASKVRITLASTPGSMPTFDYLYGTAPTITGVVKDNSALTLPLEYNAGILATASELSGSASLGDISASGGMSSTTGTITTNPFRDNDSVLLASTTIDKVVIVRASDMSIVLSLTAQVTNGAGVLVIDNIAIIPGVTYLVVSCNTAATAWGCEAYTAA